MAPHLSLKSSLAYAASLLVSVSAQTIIAPSGTRVDLARATDDAFGGFISDGGAAGFVPKWNLSLFSISDGALCKPDHFTNVSTPYQCTFPQAHDAYAAFDNYNASRLIIVGNYTYPPQNLRNNYPPGNGSFYPGIDGAGLVPWINATDSLYGITRGSSFGPAPHVAAISIPGNSTGLLTTSPVHNLTSNPKGVTPSINGTYAYTTLFEMNWDADAYTLNNQSRQVPIQRTVPSLFNLTAGQTGYGGAMLTSGRGSEANTHFYLWEGDQTGWKLARAPWATRTQISTYDYWHGSYGWVTGAPLHNGTDAYGNVYNWTSTNFKKVGQWGQNIRWVDRFQTYVITFQRDPLYDDRLYIQYSTTGAVTGPYSDPVALFDAPIDQTCVTSGAPGVNFISMHWDYYGLNADRVLFSWISCTTFQNLAELHWTTGYNNYSSPAKSYQGA